MIKIYIGTLLWRWSIIHSMWTGHWLTSRNWNKRAKCRSQNNKLVWKGNSLATLSLTLDWTEVLNKQKNQWIKSSPKTFSFPKKTWQTVAICMEKTKGEERLHASLKPATTKMPLVSIPWTPLGNEMERTTDAHNNLDGLQVCWMKVTCLGPCTIQ